MSGELNTIGNLTSIGQYAFYNCSSITGTLTIPGGITTIPVCAFTNTGITKLVIPNTVTWFGIQAFKNCSSLTDLTIPIYINAVRGNNNDAVFSGCNALTSIKFIGGENEKGQGFNYSINILGSSYSYAPWYYSRNNNLTITIGRDVSSIGDYTFYNYSSNVIYEGTQSEWANVSYNSNYNTALSNVQFQEESQEQ